MTNDEPAEKQKPPYGTFISQPDEKSGVEVGGGDKAAAQVSERARKEGQPDHEPEDDDTAEDQGSISGRSDD